MAHGDDDGVIIPPRVAPTQVVILPVIPKEEVREEVLNAATALADALQKETYCGEPVRVEIDKREMQGGAKNWEWIKKGVPVRIEIGPRDIEKGTVAVVRRDTSPKEKQFLGREEALSMMATILGDIQQALLDRAMELREQHSRKIDSMDDFVAYFTAENADKPKMHGGFALCHWAGSNEDEEKLAKDHKVTIRCIPNGKEFIEEGHCILTGKPSAQRVIFAKAY